MKWISRLLNLAEHVAGWSKDPSTQVGAVAVDGSRRVIETGYNGLPRGVDDHPSRMERPDKYNWTSHAEANLVAHAARDRLAGSTIFVTHYPCSSCARLLINAGVAEIVVGHGTTSMPQIEFEVAHQMFLEANVQVKQG